MKLPKTLHIETSRLPKGATNPDAIQFSKLDGQFLVIEEKVDGTGVSIFFDNHLDLQIWHRGHPAIGKEFWKLHDWAKDHWGDLLLLLGERYVLFGEWVKNKHAIFYDRLPHYLLESDIFDKERELWLSTGARNDLLRGHGYIHQVPVIAALKPSSLEQITSLVGRSKYQSEIWKKALEMKCGFAGADLAKALKETDSSGLMEGLYIKQEDDLQVVGRYKFIRYEFLQSILSSETHLRDRVSISNGLIGISSGAGI